MTRSAALGLEDGKEGWEESDFDARDGLEAEEAVFDLGDELGVGGLVGTGGVEGDARKMAGGEAGDGSSVEVWGGGVGGEGGGLDETCVDDVAVVGVAVAEEVEEVGWVHGCRRDGSGLSVSLTVSFLRDVGREPGEGGFLHSMRARAIRCPSKVYRIALCTTFGGGDGV